MNTDLLPLQFLSSSVFVGNETEGWTLDEETSEEAGERSFTVAIEFSTPFTTTPVVHLGLTGFDVDQASSARLRLHAVDVSPFGFTGRITTWRSTRVYSVEFQWLAVGA